MNVLTSWGWLLKAILFLFGLGLLSYVSYDYGVKTTETAFNDREQALLDKYEAKQNEAYELAVKLASSKVNFNVIERKVIKYVEKNSDKRCVANDTEWLHLRADAVREHNQTLGVQQSAAGAHDASQATHRDAANVYTSDGLILAEDIANIKTCAENAKKLADLQAWIRANMGYTSSTVAVKGVVP